MKKNRYPILHYDSVFRFGKFQGLTVDEIIKKKPDYILFLSGEGVEFTKHVLNSAKILNKNPKFPRLRKVS